MTSRRAHWVVVIAALAFPTIASFGHEFVAGDSSPLFQQIVYVGGKIIQISIPLIWLFLIHKPKLRLPKPRRDGVALGLGLGLGFGVLVFAAMMVVYYAWLKPIGLFHGPDEAVRQRVIDLGLGSTWKFIAFGVFISLLHSLFEEWYWRWFTFGQLRELISWKTALVVSSLAFMTFHVIYLALFFGWSSPATYIFSSAIAVGGGVWAWIYQRTGSIYGPWLSHLVVDVAIYYIGFDLVRDLLH